MRKYAGFGEYPEENHWDQYNSSYSPANRTSSDDLLEAVEQAMDRDSDQEFNLLLVLERKRD
jgi:hypothetical protein